MFLNDDNSVSCNVIINSKGIIYDNKAALKTANNDVVKNYYGDFFNIINNKKITNIKIDDDKNSYELVENIIFEASDFVRSNQGKVLLPVNCINQLSFVPKKYKDRKIPFEIERGFYFEDESVIIIPANLKVDTLPSEQNLISEFGDYTCTTELVGNNIIYKRKVLIKQGFYSPEKYESYRKFRENVARNENIKVVLISK